MLSSSVGGTLSLEWRPAESLRNFVFRVVCPFIFQASCQAYNFFDKTYFFFIFNSLCILKFCTQKSIRKSLLLHVQRQSPSQRLAIRWNFLPSAPNETATNADFPVVSGGESRSELVLGKTPFCLSCN